MSRSYPYAFTGDELRDGCRRCIENVKGLLNSASLLVKNRDSQQYALGLYVYAVEEFGKAILLKEYFTGNKEKYQIPGWIFGHGRLTIESISDDPILKKLLLKQLVGKSGLKINAHDAKLLIGSNNLPPECSMITRGIRISTPIPSQIIDLKSDRRIFILEGVTGSFTDKTHIFLI